MMFWDNNKDRMIDEALDELIMANRQEPMENDIDNMYQEHLANKTVCNAVALIGVQ